MRSTTLTPRVAHPRPKALIHQRIPAPHLRIRKSLVSGRRQATTKAVSMSITPLCLGSIEGSARDMTTLIMKAACKNFDAPAANFTGPIA